MGPQAGADAKTSDTVLLFLVYSIAEYWSLVCSRSTWFIFSVLNDALRVVTKCFRPSPTNHLTVFSNLQPSELWQPIVTLVLAKGGTLDLCFATFFEHAANFKKFQKLAGHLDQVKIERFPLAEVSFGCHKKPKNSI